LRANLGELPPNLCNELMHKDADSHPNPQLFEGWAKGGNCPYSKGLERLHFFNQRREDWTTEWSPLKTSDLLLQICEAKKWNINIPI